jgi:hypothetical protein
MLGRILWYLLARAFQAHTVTPELIAAVQASIDEELAALTAQDTAP